MPVISVQDSVGGATIQIEVDAVPGSEGEVYREYHEGGASRVIRATRDVFGEGLALARACAARVAETLEEITRESRPEEFTLQLAIRLDSEVGAVIAKASAGAQLQVEIKWRCDTPDRKPAAGAS
jgi:Trypsin-co-occurring domain 1